jgi:hypothetical protein
MAINKMDTYPIPIDILPYCQGRWDSDIGKFVDSNSKEVIDCCLDTCHEGVKFCFEHNDKLFGPKSPNSNYVKYKQNFDSCEEMIDDCYGTCFLYPSVGATMIRECAKKHCEIFPLDKECLKKNQETVIKCCKESCNGNTSIDCNDCKNFFDWVSNVREETTSSFSNYVLGSDKSSLALLRAKYNVHKLKFDYKTTHNALIIAVICTIILGIYIMVKTLK